MQTMTERHTGKIAIKILPNIFIETVFFCFILSSKAALLLI